MLGAGKLASVAGDDQALILGSYEAVVCLDDDILITNPRSLWHEHGTFALPK